jgi:hypothetical protein
MGATPEGDGRGASPAPLAIDENHDGEESSFHWSAVRKLAGVFHAHVFLRLFVPQIRPF